MKNLIVIQCRLGSTRLPGKALLPLAGVPMLAFLALRLQAAGLGDDLCLATTTNAEDDLTAQWGRFLGVPVVRGQVDDVLGRYLRCLQEHPADGVVRVTADNPFTSHEIVRQVTHGLAAGHDYVHGFGQCPVGTGADGFSASTLHRLDAAATTPAEREHINLRVLEHPQDFTVLKPLPEPRWRLPDVNLTVDTPEDYARALELTQGLSSPLHVLDFDDILGLLDRRAA